MSEPQIKYVAVRRDGTICGPMGSTHDEVRDILRVGHKRVGGSGSVEAIKKAGYKIRKAKIEFLDDEFEEKINNMIDEWHREASAVPIHEHLKMTWPEYQEYVKTNKVSEDWEKRF